MGLRRRRRLGPRHPHGDLRLRLRLPRPRPTRKTRTRTRNIRVRRPHQHPFLHLLSISWRASHPLLLPLPPVHAPPLSRTRTSTSTTNPCRCSRPPPPLPSSSPQCTLPPPPPRPGPPKPPQQNRNPMHMHQQRRILMPPGPRGGAMMRGRTTGSLGSGPVSRCTRRSPPNPIPPRRTTTPRIIPITGDRPEKYHTRFRMGTRLLS